MEIMQNIKDNVIKPNLQKVDELLHNSKIQSDNSQGFMEPEIKVKKANGRPRLTDEERAQRAQKQKQDSLNKTNPQTQNPQSGPQTGPQNQSATSGGPQAPHVMPSKEIAKPLVTLLSAFGTSYVGDPRAAMKPEEIEAGANALGMVLDKYMPNAMSQFGPELACFMVFGQYALRLMAMKKYLEIEKLEEEQKKKEEFEKFQNQKPENPFPGPTAIRPIEVTGI